MDAIVVVVTQDGRGAEELQKHLCGGCSIVRVDRLAAAAIYVLCKH